MTTHIHIQTHVAILVNLLSNYSFQNPESLKSDQLLIGTFSQNLLATQNPPSS